MFSTSDRETDMGIGSKVEYLGLCYRVTALKEGVATIKPFRTTKRNPRCRTAFKQIKIEALKPWKAAA